MMAKPARSKAFETAAKMTPGKALYWSNLGDAYRWTPDLRSKSAAAHDKAIALARETLALDPRDANAHLTIAVCLAKRGDLETAATELRAALDSDPDDPDTLYQAAVVSHLAGKDDEALRYLSRARQHGLASALPERDPEFTAIKDSPAFRDAVGGR